MLSTLGATMLVQIIVMMGVAAVPVLAPLLATQLSLPRDFAGAYQSIAFFGAALMTVVAGTLVRRYGGIRVNQVACALCAVGVALPILGITTVLILGAVVAGAAYGMATPGASHVLARVTTSQTRGIVFSVKQSAVTFGGLLAGLSLPALAELYNWQTALVGLAVAAVVAIVIVQPIRIKLDDDRDPTQPITFTSVTSNIALVWRHNTLRPISIAAFTYASMQVSLFALYVTLLVNQIGLSLIEAGWFYAVMQGAGVIARIGWGVVSDRWMSARPLLALIGIGSIAATTALTFAEPGWSTMQLVILSVALGSTIVGWNGVYLAEIPRQVEQHAVSAATSGTVMFSFAGIVFGPASFAAMAAYSGGYLMPVISLNVLILISAIYLMSGNWRRM
jgi:MFS family permease